MLLGPTAEYLHGAGEDANIFGHLQHSASPGSVDSRGAYDRNRIAGVIFKDSSYCRREQTQRLKP